MAAEPISISSVARLGFKLMTPRYDMHRVQVTLSVGINVCNILRKKRVRVRYLSSNQATRFFFFTILFWWFFIISSQSLNLGGRRGITDDVASFPSFPVFRCPQGISKSHSRPFLDVIFPSHLLSSSPSCSFHCPLQNCLRYARGSRDVAIPSEFPFLSK